jgi:outer membrane protein TolC
MHDLDLAVAEARVQLATAIGVPDQALDGIALETGVFDRPPALATAATSDAWRREALTRRADIQASLATYSASQSALKLAVIGQYPDVTLSPGYSYEYGINQYQLNVLATLPIFNQNQGAIAEAVAKRREAAANFIALQAQIIGELDHATVAYRKSTQSLASAEAMQTDEARRARQVEKSFGAGQADRPTLVSTQMEAAITALTNFDAMLQQREALGSLEDALERPLYGPDILLILPQAQLPPRSSS